MTFSLKALLSRFRSETSGNVTILLALGMPVLIGCAGLAVDIAQWFAWKRELQYAVDQAALAGAWARTDSATEASYQTRAAQEFAANLQLTRDFHGTPAISLVDYNGKPNSGVQVRVEGGKMLPFSSFLTHSQARVAVFAQASFEEGANYTSCIIAVDPDDDGAITIGGNASVTATCGIAALSTSDKSIIVNGNPTVDVGWILSKGGIDDWFADNTDDTVHEYMSSLADPFKGLVPPKNTTPRSYACTPASTSTTADVTVTVKASYSYYAGKNQNNATAYDYASPKPSSIVGPNTTYGQTVPNGTTGSPPASSPTVTWTVIGKTGTKNIYEVKSVATTTTYANIVATTVPEQASLGPGTYQSINVSCATVFAPGVYVIDGGRFKITGQYRVTGAGVMFVLKNGAYIDFTGGSNVSLTSMTASELMNTGVSEANAARLAGMLIFEDPQAKGTKNRNRLNGNSQTILNGKIYLPNSDIAMDGTFGVTSQCLMIAAALITIQGTADFSTFCPPGMQQTDVVGSMARNVKLVS